jgi:hypothetical protein
MKTLKLIAVLILTTLVLSCQNDDLIVEETPSYKSIKTVEIDLKESVYSRLETMQKNRITIHCEYVDPSTGDYYIVYTENGIDYYENVDEDGNCYIASNVDTYANCDSMAWDGLVPVIR